jgi:hypothetical protein
VNIVTNQEYDTFGRTEQETIAGAFGGELFGQPIRNLIVPQKNSIGYKILNNLKSDGEYERKKEREAKKRLAYGADLWGEESYTSLGSIQKQKSDYCGLGFDGNLAGSTRGLEFRQLVSRGRAGDGVQQEDSEADEHHGRGQEQGELEPDGVRRRGRERRRKL